MKPQHYLLLLACLLGAAGMVPLLGLPAGLFGAAGSILMLSVLGDFEPKKKEVKDDG